MGLMQSFLRFDAVQPRLEAREGLLAGPTEDLKTSPLTGQSQHGQVSKGNGHNDQMLCVPSCVIPAPLKYKPAECELGGELPAERSLLLLHPHLTSHAGPDLFD